MGFSPAWKTKKMEMKVQLHKGDDFHKFDERNITWREIDWLEHVSFHVYNVDEKIG